MSIKRLNIDERARYLIGVAVMRQILEAPRDPATQQEISAIMLWIEHWLTTEELEAVSIGTGIVFDELLDDALRDALQLDRKDSSKKSDDDIPF